MEWDRGGEKREGNGIGVERRKKRMGKGWREEIGIGVERMGKRMEQG